MVIKRSSTPKSNYSYVLNDSELLEIRNDMLLELQTTGSVFVLNNEVTIYDLLEIMGGDDKDYIIVALLRGGEAKKQAVMKLSEVFLSEFDDEQIEDHYINDKESY
jgi:hypothetical protein|tara:strand:+ start:4019 stop:4336 length:318 start_codon:yes stop_codon:yes gene_type:complete